MSRLPEDRPRALYYSFAHRELPNMLFRQPELFRTAALEGRVEVGTQKLWERLALEAGESSEAASKVRSTVHDCSGRFIVVIAPPSAQHTTEAHFIAVVFDRVDPDYLRYVVLERSRDFTGTPRTVLGEWTREGHINYGDGPDPIADAFLASVCDKFIDR